MLLLYSRVTIIGRAKCRLGWLIGWLVLVGLSRGLMYVRTASSSRHVSLRMRVMSTCSVPFLLNELGM